MGAQSLSHWTTREVPEFFASGVRCCSSSALLGKKARVVTHTLFLGRTYMNAPVMVVTLSIYRHAVLLSAREALRTLEGFLDHLRPSSLLLTRRARSLPGTCGLSCPTTLLYQASGKVTGVTSHPPPHPQQSLTGPSTPVSVEPGAL